MPVLVAPTLADRTAEAMLFLGLVVRVAGLLCIERRKKNPRFKLEKGIRLECWHAGDTKLPDMPLGNVPKHGRAAVSLLAPWNPLPNLDNVV